MHPCYLDTKGLVAAWREALLAQAVLQGRTKGYLRHPQLERFRRQADPCGAMATYLRGLHCEAKRRGFKFDESRVGAGEAAGNIPVTRGQMAFEWEHLLGKLKDRDPDLAAQLLGRTRPRSHPLFRIVIGPVESWEKGHLTADDERR